MKVKLTGAYGCYANMSPQHQLSNIILLLDLELREDNVDKSGFAKYFEKMSECSFACHICLHRGHLIAGFIVVNYLFYYCSLLLFNNNTKMICHHFFAPWLGSVHFQFKNLF